MLKYKIAASFGCVLEWYEFSLYGFFAPLISQLYFPDNSAEISIIKTFSVFALGFIARPIGALIFGNMSDKYGRTVFLKISPLLITFPTLFLSLIPAYSKIGILAPLLIILLRICQGICLGGEFSNNILYLCETSKKQHLFFASSIASCTGSFGILLASSVAALFYSILPFEILNSYGWRAAFAITFPFGIIVYYLRKNMPETPVFQKIKLDHSIVNRPLSSSLKNQYGDYIIALGLSLLPASAFYFTFVFLPNYMSSILNYKIGNVLSDNSISLFVRILLIPSLGILADKIGGIFIARIACFLFIFVSPLLFYLLVYFEHMGYLFYILALLTTFTAATTPGLLVSLLKPETRSTIFSFTFNVSFGVFGGIVPIICFMLVSSTNNKTIPVYYLVLTAMITLIATYFFKEKTA